MLYHEKQVAALCGVHCLNTLLQGPYFNEIDLAQIAQGLDELERALVGEGGLGEASGNVAMDGMFSIQVLSRALESWGLQVTSLESEEARAYKAAPTTAGAFICNLSEHWFTLRRVAGGDWWNFNSLFPAPQPLSTFYMQAFLDTLRGEGWTIFVVTGTLPAAQPGSLEQLPNHPGRWWSPQEARAATEEAENARKRGRVAQALEGALARAEQQGGLLQLRRRGAPTAAAAAAADNNDEDEDEDADLATAIAASLQSHQVQSQQQQQQQQPRQQQEQHQVWSQQGGGDGMMYGDDPDEYDDDPELAMAIAASLAETPAGAGAEAEAGVAAAPGQAGGPSPPQGSGSQGQAQAQQQTAPGAAEVETKEAEEEALGPEPEAEAEGVIEVAFRLPTGSRCSRRFALTSPSSHLLAFLAPLMGLPPARVALSTAFPKKELECSRDTSLSQLGLTHRTMLVAEPRR
ncbi:hypothetical protein PLESTB_001280800 [Pleodorina starrii]|uniref:Ataxin-3 homolog n=1 Tax=Pleodorina starrii TaxID=330485 RepID=A0A9W6BSV9_9CHLO|nr:hypothetical protein PLESTB_001280800 [Pleodorina starrii]